MNAEKIMLRAGLSVMLIAGVAGCHRSTVDAQTGPDPAAANLAQGNEAQQQAAQYDNGQQAPAPIERSYPNAQQPGYADNGQQPYADDQVYGEGDDQYAPVYDDSLTDEQATEPPPPLPDYDQPPAPDPDYIWTPGYWAWGPDGYYWVPGCWVDAPYVGALWTPGYWGFVGGRYRFHHGYWARHIGFYGGINYGFGYFGVGYEGGYWNGPHFYYNTVVTHVNRDRVRDVYVRNIAVNRGGARVSFNGGRGGLQVRPRPAEISALHEQRYAPMQAQVQLRDQASHNRQQFYSANHGRPAESVAARPVTSDHRMPAEMPRVAARPEGRGGATGANRGNRGPETARPGQMQAPGTQRRPDFRSPQQGGQVARPENTPRGNAAPETARPGQLQQGRPEFQQRGQEARPVQPQNDVHPPAAQQPQGRQFDRRGQQPQAQPQQARPDFQQRQQQQPQAQPQQPQRQELRGQQGRPDFQQRQQQQPQAQPQQQQRQELRGQQGRPDFQQRQQQMRQQAPAQPQAQPRPQQQMRQQGPPPQAQRQAPQPQAAPQQQRGPEPQRQGPPPQGRDNGRGGGHDQDRH
jgi:hypothetical protein